MSDWTPDTLPWDRFDRRLVDDDLAEVIGGLALVESRADLYGDYLQRVLSKRFAQHPDWSQRIAVWSGEEDQHGTALRRWFALARPDVDVDGALARYRRDVAYHDAAAKDSVRGSIEQELVCRCVIEALATTLYAALGARTKEPALKATLKHLAADEARHYRFFSDLLAEERRSYGTNRLGCVRAMVTRLRALDDDQIMRASHAASHGDVAYDASATRGRLLPLVYASYDDVHLKNLARLLARPVGVDDASVVQVLGVVGGSFLRGRAAWLRAKTPTSFGARLSLQPS